MNIPKNSPWGKVQNHEFITPWLVQVSTASHGGCKIEPNYNNLIPSHIRRENCWYEEDCDILIILFHLHEKICKDTNEERRQEIEKQISDGSLYNQYKFWFNQVI
jgi:hypothetical protein